jgi:hypothetical protein
MSILGIDANWQRAVKGIVLLVAVLVDISTQKNRGTKGSPFGGMFRGKSPKTDGAADTAPN